MGSPLSVSAALDDGALLFKCGVSNPAKLFAGCPLSDRRGNPKVTPARISLIAWPFVSSWRNATSKDSLSVIFQIAPIMSETVSDRPNSFS